MNDVEWDIFMLEIEVRNVALIQEFMIAKMRPRDLAQLTQENNGETQQLDPQTGGEPSSLPQEG